MQVKTAEASSEAEAIQKLKEELGNEVLAINTTKIVKPTAFGLLKKTIWQATAVFEEVEPEPEIKTDVESFKMLISEKAKELELTDTTKVENVIEEKIGEKTEKKPIKIDKKLPTKKQNTNSQKNSQKNKQQNKQQNKKNNAQQQKKPTEIATIDAIKEIDKIEIDYTLQESKSETLRILNEKKFNITVKYFSIIYCCLWA